MKLLYTGDWHLRGTTPRNRTDDYKEAVIRKLNEIFSIAKKQEAHAIICAGDVFDRPEVSISVLLEFAAVIKKSPCPIYTTAGNHDIYGYNLSTYERTSLRLLELLVPQLMVINDPSEPQYVSGYEHSVQLTFTPYSGKIDVNGYGYSPETDPENAIFHTCIHTAHGMLLDHEPPFDRYTTIAKVETIADLVLTGHDHLGYGIFKRKDGVVFVNCGSITRLSASQTEMERTVQVLLIDVKGTKDFDLELIPLESAKPGKEILDRSRIEAEKKRQYAMEEFASLIQTDTGETQLLDVNQIVESIAKKEKIDPEIVRMTLDKIDEQRELVK